MDKHERCKNFGLSRQSKNSAKFRGFERTKLNHPDIRVCWMPSYQGKRGIRQSFVVLRHYERVKQVTTHLVKTVVSVGDTQHF